MRRRYPGHTEACPYQHQPARGCSVCAGERKGRPDVVTTTYTQALTATDDDWPAPAPPPTGTLTACPHCYAPTTTADTHTCRW